MQNGSFSRPTSTTSSKIRATARRASRAIMRFPALLIVAVSAVMIFGVHLAHAAIDTVPVPVDAIATGVTASDAGWSLIQAYGPLWGGLALVLGLSQRLLANNAAQHWLAQGRLLTAITGAVGVIGSIAQWRWTGAPSSGIVVTAFGAISLLWHSTVTKDGVPVGFEPASEAPAPAAKLSTVAPSSVATKSTAVATLIALLIGGVVLQPACTAAQVRDLKAVGQTIWDCTAPERAEIVTLLVPLFSSLLTAATSADGKSIDTSALKAATSKSNLMSDASVALECAKAKAFSDAMSAPASTPGAPAAAGLVINPDVLRDAYNRVRPAGSTFILPGGKVL